MAQMPTYRVRETLLSQKPREWSLEVAGACLCFVMAMSLWAWRNGAELLPILAATPDGVFARGEYWRLVTAVAVHADVMHVVSNVFLLTFFAYLLFGYFGFWVFPALSLGMGALTNYLALLTYPSNVILLGASGVVYWMAGFWLIMYLLVERRVRTGTRVLRVVCLGLLVLLPTSFQPSVSYRSHAIGLGLGVASAVAYFWRNRGRFRRAEVWEIEDPVDDFEEILPS
jgi:rhomboid protease GluP